MTLKRRLGQFAADERGATAIEYGLIAGLIAVAIVGGLDSLQNTADQFPS